MIELTKDWAIGSDNVQWVIYRKGDPNKAVRKTATTTTVEGKWKPAYYFPRLEQAISRVVQQEVWAADLNEFIEIYQKQKSTYEDIIEKLKISKGELYDN